MIEEKPKPIETSTSDTKPEEVNIVGTSSNKLFLLQAIYL